MLGILRLIVANPPCGPLEPFEGVGGHGGMLHSGGCILKPAPAGSTAWKEGQFYERVRAACASSASTQQASMWCTKLPKFHGIVEHATSMNSTPTPFIALEDISFGMLSPCIMDIKVGVQSWDEDAPPHKAAREAAKWPLQQRLGFRFTGMYVTWPSAPSRSPLKVGTEFAYSLTPATFIDALCTFAGDDCRTSLSSQDWKLRVLPVFLSLLQQLQSLLIAVKTQHEYRVYGSSVLAAYDAAQEQPSVQLALIDFGHVWPITNEPAGVDSGLIQGIETLLLFTVSAMLQSQARAFT